MSRLVALVLVAGTLVACGSDGHAPERAAAKPAAALTVSFDVDEPVRSGAAVTWHVVVHNGGSAADLRFPTAKDADVVLTGPAGDWRWSGERMFTQNLRLITVQPGDTTFDLTTEALDLPAGSYDAHAELASETPVVGATRTITVVSG